MENFRNQIEIPLKAPAETYVDDPTCLEDINIDDLEFDLDNNIKHINRLHVFHAIAIFKACLEDIKKLQSNEELFEEFRAMSIERLGIKDQKYTMSLSRPDTDPSHTHSSISETNIGKTISEDSEDSEISSFTLSKSTDSLGEHEITSKNDILGTKVDSESPLDCSIVDKSECVDLYSDKQAPPFIPINELATDMCLQVIIDPITSQSPARLLREIKYNESIKASFNRLIRSFNLLKAPTLSLEQFLLRIKTYSSSTSVPVYIHSAYLLYKICILLNVVRLTDLNVHRLILASLRCSTKILEDIYQKQSTFAQVGGVSNKELLKLEMSFLFLCNFKLVTGKEILDYFLKEEFVLLRKYCKQHFA